MERVVVAGAGPVGLTVALVLASRDVPVTVLEAGEWLSAESRASTFHPSTLELLEPLGITDELLRIGLRAPRFQYRDREQGVYATFDLSALADVYRYPFRIQCEQNKMAAIALERLKGFACAEVLFNHPVDEVNDDGLSSREHTVAGSFVVGADGAHSVVRRSLGIGFDGLTYPERFMVVSTTFDFAEAFDGLAFVNYVSDPNEWLVLLRTPDHWRVLFPIGEDEDEEHARAPGAVEARLQRVFGRAEPYPVLHTTFYNIHQRVASTFRSGRAFLAGDAAHINNPLGGMGMNSGLHDAVSLGTRVGDVWHGVRDETCLDEYATLRRRIALEIVDRQSRANKARVEERDPSRRVQIQAEQAAMAADPVQAREYMLRATLFASAREAT